MRREGFIVFPYFDNWLFTGNYYDMVNRAAHILLSLLPSLGVGVHREKSMLISTRCIDFVWGR